MPTKPRTRCQNDTSSKDAVPNTLPRQLRLQPAKFSLKTENLRSWVARKVRSPNDNEIRLVSWVLTLQFYNDYSRHWCQSPADLSIVKYKDDLIGMKIKKNFGESHGWYEGRFTVRESYFFLLSRLGRTHQCNIFEIDNPSLYPTPTENRRSQSFFWKGYIHWWR